ncbi:MAG: hypothetical protein HWE22_16060 [Flavobacteriales bacterium]|nr:hypothetical protein [Flavobacteriales bacterium]
MRHVILLFLITSLLLSCKSTWHLYKPAQSGIVGKRVNDYSKQNQQISLGPIHTFDGTIETVDNPSTATENQLIEKNIMLDLKGFLNKKTTVTNVKVTNATVTNIKSLKNVNPGNFVYSAIKAEKVTVTLKVNSNTEIKPEELIEELQKYIQSLNPAIADVATLVKEISVNSTNESTYEILNPDVYYCFQEAVIRENQGIKHTYYKDFVTIHGGDYFILNEDYSVSKDLFVVVSKEFEGVVDRIVVQLVYKKENGIPNLYVRYNTRNGSELKLIPRLSDKVWNSLNFQIKEYDLSSKAYKLVRMDIAAELIDNGIRITRGKVSYPEKTIEIVKR